MVLEKPKRKPFSRPYVYFGAGVFVTLLVVLLVIGWQQRIFSPVALPADAAQSVQQSGVIAEGVLDAALAPAGDVLALLAWDDQEGARLYVHDLTAPRSLSENLRYMSGSYSRDSRLLFAPDGTRLLLTSVDIAQIVLLDAVTGTALRTFSGQAATFLPDGTALIVNGSTLLHVNSDGSKTLAEIRLTLDGSPYRMTASPDGTRIALATASASGSQVSIYRTSDWSLLPRTFSTPETIQALAFHPGAAYLALTHESGALVLELESSSTRTYTFENQGLVRALSFAPDGELLAIAGGDVSAGEAAWIYVVRWAAPDVIPPFEDYFFPTLLAGHQQDVTALSFTADGLLLSASRDGSIRLWDTELQQEVSRLQISG